MTDSQKVKFVTAELIKRGKIKNENDLCDKLGYNTANFTKIKNGQRKIPASLKLALITKFGVSEEYLSNNKEPILIISQSVERHPQKVEEPEVVYAGLSAEQSNSMLSILERLADSVVSSNEVFRKIIIKGLDQDAILFDTKKVGVSRKEIPG